MGKNRNERGALGGSLTAAQRSAQRSAQRASARRPQGRRGGRRTLSTRVLLALEILIAALLVLGVAGVGAQSATSGAVTFDVSSARTEPRALGGAGVHEGDPISDFKYLINIDNTGTTEQRSPADGCSPSSPGYPGSCNWPSIQEAPNPSPIFRHGDQDDFANGARIEVPPGRYLISVIADGYKIDGVHFTVPESGGTLDVSVQLQPNPLPDSTIRGQVFADNAPTNGTQDPDEPGLQGFVGHITDYLGEVSTDVYGNPLCTVYKDEDPVTHAIPASGLDSEGAPIPVQQGGNCLSDANGLLTIPHMGTNRYALSATPPDGQTWIQTTTLEGNHDWDAWVMEGSTGFDTETVLAGEPVPQPLFGFAKPTNTFSAGGTGHIKGTVVGIKSYTPPKGGAFDFWGGNTGTKVDAPIKDGWLSLADLDAGDVAVWVGRANPDGTFDIPNVPDGNYSISWWDEAQDHNLNMINVTIKNGETVEMGNLPLNGWWTRYEGYVYNDANRNGVKDPGEKGISGFTLTLRRRENSLMDRGQTSATTDASGHYLFEAAYPTGEWMIMEAYNDSFYTTGVTYQADNQPDPTTVKGAGVDVSVLNIIGLSGTIDWGVHAYDPSGTNGVDPQNGGIVGTVSYDTTRNELDPRYAAAEDWQPGISGLTVELRAPVDCGTSDPSGVVDPVPAVDEVQTLTLTAGAEGDTFTLSFNGHESAPVTMPAGGFSALTATDIQAAIDSISDFAIDKPVVAGGVGGPFTITFSAGALAGTDQTAITVTSPTGTAAGAVAETAKGVAAIAGSAGEPVPCDASGRYELAPDGSFAKGKLLNTYVTEHWSRPSGCTARNVDGIPLFHGVDENVLANNQETGGECISSFIQSIQFGPYPTDQDTADANFGAAVDGNYGFGDACTGTLDATDPENPVCNGGDFEPLGAGDYLVSVNIPKDASGKPMYDVTREEDINIGNGDQIIPQVPPPACVGELHTVDVKGFEDDGYPQLVGPNADLGVPAGVTVPPSDATENATFVDIGGSPYEGQPRPLCDVKLVSVNNGKSVVPVFNLFTEVPIPTRLRGLMVDDINFSTDPRSTMYGEKRGIPFAPVGIYDFANRLVDTVETDFNGVYETLLPSTNHISCPTPSGVCANMYRFVANDPGVPGRLNPNFNPSYRTIATEFEAFPGLIIPTDLAPTQVGVTVESPATGLQANVICALDSATPQLFAVSKPYVNGSGTFTIDGTGFGLAAGKVVLDGTITLPTTTWSSEHITVTVPAGTAPGSHQLHVIGANGQSTVNGLSFHVLSPPTAGPFPTNGVLDAFNRSSSSSSQTLGGNWLGAGFLGGSTPSATNYRITPSALTGYTNQAQVRGSGGDTYFAGGNSFGANQEAFVTFTKTIDAGGSRVGGLLLKRGALGLSFISVRYIPGTGVRVQTYVVLQNTVTRATFSGVSFAAGDRLGARALDDGTVTVYKNAAIVGSTNVASGTNPWPAVLVSGGGRIGLTFAGSFSDTTGNDVRLDDFGGGNVTLTAGYSPNLYEVGPNVATARYNPTNAASKSADGVDHAIQNALDDAAASPGNDIVVVYPNTPDLANPRNNPRGAYYENLVIASPVKLQGVGPGGFQGSTFVPGSIIDAAAFGGDSQLITEWYTKVTGLTWDGNQNINDGEAIYVLASENATTASGRARQFTSGFKAAIDGFDIRGGDQRGFPNNLSDLTGAPTGLPPTVVTQGGAIFANAYARYLQITNNVVQNNGGAYGTIRIGTPDLPSPDTNQHNENVRLAYNRVISNGGTNLAGGIGLFSGSDNYEVERNDICGNFSLEYGGGLSVYGRSPNGRIHHNRIYFNNSNDEGGGIMIAGQLPLTQGTLSPGSGAVDIYANQIQANLANDDGGGIRFLMAGGSGGTDAMNVFNNMIVNNVSTHEGGAIGIDDAPNVRIYNNTIMKNLTTATAVTSNGQPAPAGISTTSNSSQLQATLLGGSPTFSRPLLFNNILWDNRAGTRSGTTVVGIGLAGDATPINHWDIGVADGTGVLAPTNSTIQQSAGTHPYTTSATNSTANPGVVQTYDVSVSVATWRQNPAFVDATLVALEQPANLLGNYHLAAGSPAINLGAASKTSVNAPATDFDDQVRPAAGAFDSGADEYGAAPGGTPPPSPPPTPAPGTADFYFSTRGNQNPPGVTGTADDSDIYRWNGTAYGRTVDATGIGIPASADVDGYVRVSDTQFYVSFNGNTVLPGIGTVQDEDIVYYNGTAWSVAFDGTAHGLTTDRLDIDAASIVGGQIYFSTRGNQNPPGVTGTADDADIYRWNGSAFSRVWDATANGLPASAKVDGYDRVDATHFYMSFDTDVSVPGLGTVQDEDIVYYDNGTWSVYFDGTAHGLTTDALDLEAFDVP